MSERSPFYQSDMIHPLITGMDIKGKQAIEIYFKVEAEFKRLNAELTKYKRFKTALEEILQQEEKNYDRSSH